ERRDKNPGPCDLFFDRLLLVARGGRQEGKAQSRDQRNTEDVTTVHCVSPLEFKCDPHATAQFAAAGGNGDVKERRYLRLKAVPAGGTSAAICYQREIRHA